MADVIRQDVIEVGFDTNFGELTKINSEMDELKKSVIGVGKTDGLEKLKSQASKVKDATDDLGDSGNKTKSVFDKFKSVDVSKLNSGLDKVGRQLTNIAKKAGGAALTGLKKLAGISFKTLIAGLGAAGVAIFKLSDMASDLEETKNKVDVAFGKGDGTFDKSAKTVMDWSKTSTTAMGLAQQTALDTAALFGDMGTSMGLTKKEAADMSMTLTQQAADLASFKNMSIDEVTTALNGVFTGETESLKRLGVVMTQTNLEQYALSKGMKKSLKEMTEAEKVQLRYAYVMEKTKNATGDFERTGGGFANQLRTLKENFKQLGAVIGSMPMTKLAAGMKVINDEIAKVQEILGDGFQEGDTDKIMNIVNGLIDKGMVALSDGLPKILPLVLSVISTVASGLVKSIPKIAPTIAVGIVQLMMGLGKIIIQNAPALLNAAKQVVIQVVKAIYEGFTGKQMSGDMFANLKSKVSQAFTAIQNIISGVISFGQQLMSFLAPVLSFIGNLALNIFSWIGNNINWLLPLVASLVGAFILYKTTMTAINVVQKIMAVTSSLLSGTLPTVAAGTTAAGTASATSATQIGMAAKSFMQMGVGVLAVGVGILAVCLGFALLTQSAIALAGAGWGAIAVMLGMVAAIALLAWGATFLGAALTAGAVGFLAFGGAIALVGVGFALIGVGALLAANSLRIVATVLPIIVACGLQGAVSIIALGASLAYFAIGAGIAGAASLILGAGLLVVAAALVVIAVSLTAITLMFTAMTVMMTVFRAAITVLPSILALLVPQMMMFAMALTPLALALTMAVVPLTLFTGLLAILAVSFTILAVSSTLVVLSFTALVMLFGLIAISSMMLITSLTPLPLLFMSLVPSVLMFTMAITPLTMLFTVLGVSALIFAVSMTVLSVAMVLVNAMMLVFTATMMILPSLFMMNNVFVMLLTVSLTMLAMSLTILTPMVLMFTMALLPLSATMLLLVPSTLLFTTTMAALMAVFVILAPLSLLFATSMMILAPMFAILAVSVPIVAKAIKPLAKEFTKLIIPTGLLAVALAPLSAEFVLLAASAVALLVAVTGLVASTMMLSTLFMMITVTSAMLVVTFNVLGTTSSRLVGLLLPLTVALLSMVAPLTVVSAQFITFAASVMIVASASMVITTMFTALATITLVVCNAMINLANILSNSITVAMTKAVSVTQKSFNKMIVIVQTSGLKMVVLFTQTLRQMTLIIRSTNLTSEGMQLMNGLIRGMNSRKAAAIATARAIAQAINREFDKVQKIHSPSKVWQEKGSFMLQGGIVGMEKTMPKLQQTAEKAGSMAMPYSGHYTPESTTSYSHSRNTEHNTYSPYFSVTISGTNDDRAMARKVKRWIAEALDDTLSGYDDKNPQTQEV